MPMTEQQAIDMLAKLDLLLAIAEQVGFLLHVLALVSTFIFGQLVWIIIRDAMDRRTL